MGEALSKLVKSLSGGLLQQRRWYRAAFAFYAMALALVVIPEFGGYQSNDEEFVVANRPIPDSEPPEWPDPDLKPLAGIEELKSIVRPASSSDLGAAFLMLLGGIGTTLVAAFKAGLAVRADRRDEQKHQLEMQGMAMDLAEKKKKADDGSESH